MMLLNIWRPSLRYVGKYFGLSCFRSWKDSSKITKLSWGMLYTQLYKYKFHLFLKNATQVIWLVGYGEIQSHIPEWMVVSMDSYLG